MSISRTITLALMALASLTLSALAQTVTTHLASTIDNSLDTWNNSASWDNGVPDGNMDAVIQADKEAHANSEFASTITVLPYFGNLTLESGSTLKIYGDNENGSGNGESTENIKALGGGTITMESGSFLRFREDHLHVIPNPIILTGNNARIRAGESTSGQADLTFTGGITGDHHLLLEGNSGSHIRLAAANSFASVATQVISANGWDQNLVVHADAAGSLGGGNIIIADQTSLEINAADAMSDRAFLILDGAKSSMATAKLVMNASDTVKKLYINGIRQPAGTYTNSESWLDGSGTLTVLIDDTLTVANADDASPDSLRDAIASADPGDTIVFDPSLSGQTITLTGGQILIDKDLTIDGSSLPNGITFDGNNASRIVEVSSGQTILLVNLTLTGGNGEGSTNSGNGGAVSNSGTLTLEGCTVTLNSASRGGGIHNAGGAILNLIRSTVSQNTAAIDGGGMMLNPESISILRNSTISGNTATFKGAGIYLNLSSNATITHCTIAGNTAGNQGGGSFSRGTVILNNTIVAGNSAPNGGPDFYRQSATVTPTGVNLLGDVSNSSLSPGATVLVGDPVLAPLGNYGGPTRTMLPLPGSPVIDAGVILAGAPATDQRGEDRLIGSLPDIGAVEVDPLSGAQGLVARDPKFVNTWGAYVQTDVITFEPTTIYLDYGLDENLQGGTLEVVVEQTGVSTVGASLDYILPNFFEIFANPGQQGFYRFRTDTLLGELQSFTAGHDSLLRSFPAPPELVLGSVNVSLTPSEIGGWRFMGERVWRSQGTPVIGLVPGERTIVFQPEPGYLHPPSETVEISVGAAETVERIYYETPVQGAGGLSVTLAPAESAAPSTPVSERAQWRLLGEDDGQWRDSGTVLTGLFAGNYLVECKPVVGLSAPKPSPVTVQADEAAALTLAYSQQVVSDIPFSPVSFSAIATDETKPYAFVGQVRSDVGCGTGFVVTPGVVLTAGHIAFDSETFTTHVGLEWLFQRDRGTYEPKPRIPRGVNVTSGYHEEDVIDMAAMYFVGDAGRGGFSGFLKLPGVLTSSADKMLVGYPLEGIPSADEGRMHATSPANLPLIHSNLHFYDFDGVLGGPGFAGAPLFVRAENGQFYPAAIHLGGNTVRAFDGPATELIEVAQGDALGMAGPIGSGGITLTSFTGAVNPGAPGALKVIIEPQAAWEGGAFWGLAPESPSRPSGSQKGGLYEGVYNLKLSAVAGFEVPEIQAVPIVGGQVTTVTFTYQAVVLSPLELWRLDNFETTENSGDAADDADPDKDGRTNIEEYAAGTNPNDAADYLKITDLVKSGGTFGVTLAGKADRAYKLQRNVTLSGEWTNVDLQGPLVEDGEITLTDASAPDGSAYYRVEVSVDP